MSQPSAYERATNFSAHQASNPTLPLPAGPLDEEFARIQAVINEIRANLAVIQRDDAQLANRSVGFDQLKVELHAGMNEPTIWATETSYTLRDAVFVELRLYRCLETHVSGVFADDLASGKWVLLADFTGSGMHPYSAVLAALAAALAASPMASQGEAESGTINNKLMTPLRTKQFLDKNRPIASQVEAENGTLNDKVMTPLRTAQHLAKNLSLQTNAISVAAPLFGATTSGSQTPAARRAAMQAAIDYGAANGLRVIIPAGTWETDKRLSWRSGSSIEGAGKDVTIIKLADGAGENEPVLAPIDSNVRSYFISDLTCDGNFARPHANPVGTARPGGSCVSTNGSKFGFFHRVRATGGILHGFDVCNAGEVSGVVRYYVAPENEALTYYPNNPSEYIWLSECEADNCGDDCFTVHYSSYVWWDGCYAHDAGDRHPTSTACNGFECDDGARYVYGSNLLARNVTRAFVVKSHSPEPVAKKVEWTNVHAQDCSIGLMFDNEDSVADGAITVNGAIIERPSNRGIAGNTIIRALHVSGYKNVRVNGLIAEGIAGDATLSQAITIGSGGDAIVNGFRIRDWPTGETTLKDRSPIYVTSTAGVVTLTNGVISGFGLCGLWKTGSGAGVSTLHVDNLHFAGSGMAGSVAMSYQTQNPSDSGSTIGSFSATGVTNKLELGTNLYTAAISMDGAGRRICGAISTGRVTHDELINKLELPLVSTSGLSGEVLRIAGANHVARFYQTGGDIAGSSVADTALRLTANTTTSRSLNAAGTINASGADYAEYHEVKPHLYGSVPKGAILGYAADGLLTDRWADIVGRFVIKSTNPYGVGGDAWGAEERICARHGCEPVGSEPEFLEPADDGDIASATVEHDAAVADWRRRQAAFEAAHEAERAKWDRIAKAGYVPVNIEAAASDIGKYLVPAEDDGGITATLVAEADLTLPQYIRAIGCVIGITGDGRPLVEVKVG